MNRAERGSARAAEQVFRTCALMQSGTVAESKLRVVRNISTFLGAKDPEFRSSRVHWKVWVERASGWGHKIWNN